MSKCTECRKAEALDTRWDKFKSFWMWHFFGEEVHDHKAASYTAGFGDGYAKGYQAHKDVQAIVERIRAEQDAKTS